LIRFVKRIISFIIFVWAAGVIFEIVRGSPYAVTDAYESTLPLRTRTDNFERVSVFFLISPNLSGISGFWEPISMAPKVTNLFVSSALLLGLSVTSFARIGETMDEAVKRYGEVVHHGITYGEELYSFKKNGFNILAHFHEGKIDRIMYSSESGRKLTDEEIDSFLKANNHGRPMNEDLPYIWVGKDAAATYSKWPRDAWHLDIKARTFGRKRIVAKKPTEKAKLEGF
jgi:hypothetical protein